MDIVHNLTTIFNEAHQVRLALNMGRRPTDIVVVVSNLETFSSLLTAQKDYLNNSNNAALYCQLLPCWFKTTDMPNKPFFSDYRTIYGFVLNDGLGTYPAIVDNSIIGSKAVIRTWDFQTLSYRPLPK